MARHEPWDRARRFQVVPADRAAGVNADPTGRLLPGSCTSLDARAGFDNRRASPKPGHGRAQAGAVASVRARVRGGTKPRGRVVAPLPRAAPARRRRRRAQGPRRLAADGEGLLPPCRRVARRAGHRRAGAGAVVPCGEARPSTWCWTALARTARSSCSPRRAVGTSSSGSRRATPGRPDRTSPCRRHEPPGDSSRSSSTATSATRGRSATSRRRRARAPAGRRLRRRARRRRSWPPSSASRSPTSSRR